MLPDGMALNAQLPAPTPPGLPVEPGLPRQRSASLVQSCLHHPVVWVYLAIVWFRGFLANTGEYWCMGRVGFKNRAKKAEKPLKASGLSRCKYLVMREGLVAGKEPKLATFRL